MKLKVEVERKISKSIDKVFEAIVDPEIMSQYFISSGSMMEAFKYPAHGGRLIYVGLVKSEISFNDPDFHSKELTLMGSRNATREDFDYVVNTVKNGGVDLSLYPVRYLFEYGINQA